MTQGIAFFDFDDTLARGDSILPFLLYCIRKRIAPGLFEAGQWTKRTAVRQSDSVRQAEGNR